MYFVFVTCSMLVKFNYVVYYNLLTRLTLAFQKTFILANKYDKHHYIIFMLECFVFVNIFCCYCL